MAQWVRVQCFGPARLPTSMKTLAPLRSSSQFTVCPRPRPLGKASNVKHPLVDVSLWDPKKLSYSLDSWFTSSLLAYSKFQCCSSNLNCRSPLNRWFHPQLLLGYGLYPHHPMSISFHQWIRGSCPKSTSLITQPWGRVISPFHFLRSSNIITSQWQAQWSQHTLSLRPKISGLMIIIIILYNSYCLWMSVILLIYHVWFPSVGKSPTPPGVRSFHGGTNPCLHVTA